MPIKLNKVLIDLNVGLKTAVEFLVKKGHEIESNPNVKINEEQHALLVKEFGSEPSILKDKKSFVFPTYPKRQRQETAEVIKTEVPETARPKFVIKDKINLSALDSRNRGGAYKPERKQNAAQPSGKNQQHHKDKHKFGQPVKQEQKQPKPVVAQETVKPVEVKPEPVVEVTVIADTQPTVPTEQPPTPPPTPTPPPSGEQPKEQQPKEEQPRAEEPEKATPKEQKPQQQTPQHGEQRKQEQKPKGNAGQQARPDQKKDRPEKFKKGEPITIDVEKEEVFRLAKRPPDLNFKVTGKIDLSAINQASFPRRKTKEDYKREHDKEVAQRRLAHLPHKTPTLDKKPNVPGGAANAGPPKQKRKRITQVDVAATPGRNLNFHREERVKPSRIKRPIHTEVKVEDVQKQVKETLARLTNKGTKGKGAKYRRDKRDAAANREQEILEQEQRESKVLKLTEFVTANDLSSMMNIPVTQVISTCMSIGIMVSINQRLEAETINIVAEEFGYSTEYVSAEVVEAITVEEDKEDELQPRPPIITVMGHVDHGKTSLLDNIRKTNVIAGEAGGITQHIGAYNVKLPNGRHITFLDTPGHEAFTAMRARGAKATDIAIIIVAADDNVMPQTIEAINHASAANVPIVFAINKIDKPHSNAEKIKEELANLNYLVEDWGGKYQSQEISAKQGTGVPELLEKVLLEADILELKANPDRRAQGSIIESSLDKGRGFVSTILVSNGTLRQGDIVLAGSHYGRIKAMFNERNQRIELAAPSEPAIILGLNGAPQAGDLFNVLETEQEAKEIANRREQLQRELGHRTMKRRGFDDIVRRRAMGDIHELNLIVKGDVDGSVEALSDSLIKLSTEEVQVHVIHKAVGQISESDVSLAAAADEAVIIGFQVRPSAQARRLAESEGVEIRLYSIIYDAINEVKSVMEGMLSPEIREDITGELEVLQVFKITNVGTIAGCIVKEGKIRRANKVRVIRDGIVVHAGELGSLKRFKDEVKEAFTGQDCGLYIHNYNDIQIGDIIEPFDQTEIKKTLS